MNLLAVSNRGNGTREITTRMNERVFISFSRPDDDYPCTVAYELAGLLHTELKAQGFDPFWDHDIKPSETWKPKLRRKIYSWCQVGVVLVSERSLTGLGWVRDEASGLMWREDRKEVVVFAVPIVITPDKLSQLGGGVDLDRAQALPTVDGTDLPASATAIADSLILARSGWRPTNDDRTVVGELFDTLSGVRSEALRLLATSLDVEQFGVMPRQDDPALRYRLAKRLLDSETSGRVDAAIDQMGRHAITRVRQAEFLDMLSACCSRAIADEHTELLRAHASMIGFRVTCPDGVSDTPKFFVASHHRHSLTLAKMYAHRAGNRLAQWKTETVKLQHGVTALHAVQSLLGPPEPEFDQWADEEEPTCPLPWLFVLQGPIDASQMQALVDASLQILPIVVQRECPDPSALEVLRADVLTPSFEIVVATLRNAIAIVQAAHRG